MRIRIAALVLPVFFLPLSCKSRSFSTSFSSVGGQAGALYKPVADVVGRIILPDFSSLTEAVRVQGDFDPNVISGSTTALWKEDSVLLELSADVPGSELKAGQKVWLTWFPETRRILEHDAKVLSKVEISERFRSKMLNANDPSNPEYGQLNATEFGREVLPLRLHDFTQTHNTRVGPLMSLAGGRPKGLEPFVKLVGPQKIEPIKGPDGTEATAIVYVEKHPVMVEGSQRALVKFLAPVDGSETNWKVRHWANGGFEGPEETIVLDPPRPRSAHNLPGYDFGAFAKAIRGEDNVPTLINGERSRLLNEEGFYIFGDRKQDVFVVMGLTPRALVRADSKHLDNWATRDRSKKRKSNKIWQEGFFDVAPNHLIGFRSGAESRTEQTSEKTSWWLGVHNGGSEAWNMGDRALLVHIFGGIGGPKGDNIKVLDQDNQMSPGHFAFGAAEVVEDPFTRLPVFDITYHQIYAHSPDGILSGPQAWHVYMGSLRRGWAFARPVGDVLYKNSELSASISLPLSIGGQGVELKTMTVLEALTNEFDTLAAHYRTGFGQGIAEVNSVTSCSQDSILALNKALIRFKDNGFDSDLRKNASRVFLKQGVVFRPIRGDWEKYLKTGQRVATTGQLATLVAALRSHNSMTPREAWNEMNKLLGKEDTPTILIRSNGLMSNLEGQYPLEPTNVLMLGDHLRKISGQIIRNLIFKDAEP